MQHRPLRGSFLFAMAIGVVGLGNTHCGKSETAPKSLTYSTKSAVYTVGTPIAQNSPSSTGGTVASYSVSPALPAGLALNLTTGVISGTPTAAASTANYFVTASNTGGSTTATITITVNDTAPVDLKYSNNPAVYTVGTPILPNKPSNSGGKIVSYSGGLAPGLSIDPVSGVISGTPTTVSGAVNYTVIAINTGGNTTAALTITVNDLAPTKLSYATASAVYTVGAAIAVNAPSSSGGTVGSYSVAPALPAGLRIDPLTGVISGTPTAVAAMATYTITASNFVGSTTATVTITVDNIPPTNLTYSASPVVYTVGTPIAQNSPSSSGGAVVTYSVLPALPAGLVLSPTTGIISGTPTAVAAKATYTVTATNTGGSTTGTVTITVNDIAPAITYSSNPATYTKGQAIPANTPTSTGGAILSYVAPTLPAGLSINTSTGVITGTPSALSTATNYPVTATNSGGQTTVQLNITVNDAKPAFTYAFNPVTYVKGTAISPNTPTSTGGTILSYAAPTLPAGLSINTSTGVITGTPTTVSAATNYPVTATNSGGPTTVQLNITVNDVKPAFTYAFNPVTYVQGAAIAPNTPTSTGGTILSYAAPTLPAGLSINTATGVITGTPTTVSVATNYPVTATNSGGPTTVQLNITVNDIPPAFTYAFNPATYTVGTAITNTPTSTGGTILSYAAPTLPPGLSINTSTGVITGTPTTASAATNYPVTATNSGGPTTVQLSITVNDIPPAFTYVSNPATYTVGTAIIANTPTSTGGTILSYSAPTLPGGLSIDTTTGIITGTPTTASVATNYPVTATNSGGPTTVQLNITVNASASKTLAPSNLAYSTNPAEYAVGTAIPVNVPSNSGGGVSAYSVLPALPAGLSLSTTTGVISGTPTTATLMANYTVTATNAAGNTTATVTLTVSPSLPTGFALVANSNDGTLSLYTVNAVTGPLRANGYVTAGTNPRSVAVDPTGNFAYVTGSSGVLAYALNPSTGVLSSLGTTAAGTQPSALSIDPSGRFVYVVNLGSNDVSAFTLNASTGALTTVGPTVSAGLGPSSVAVDPSGRFTYVANADGTVSAYTINQSTGALTAAGSPQPAGTGPSSIAVEPSGRFVYVANATSNDISAFTINESTGALTSVGPTVAAGKGAASIGVEPTGRFAYAANSVDNTVSAFTIDASTGALTNLGSTVASGTGPSSITVDPSGSFVYVANSTSANVSIYALNASSGALTLLQTMGARTGATSVALVQRATTVRYVPKFVYVTNSGDNTISAYTLNAGTGALAAVGSAVTGTAPASISIVPSGRYAYVANATDGTVSVYVLDASTGALTAVGAAVTTGTKPVSVTVDPSGRFVYVANSGANTVSAYALDPSTGLLTAVGSAVATGMAPASVSVDPSGRFVYVANATDGTVSSYGINAATGALASLGPDIAAGRQPMSVSVDPWGGYAYVANATDGTVSVFAINPSTGVLTAVGSAVATGTQPMSISVGPWSGSAYVANATDGTVSAYSDTVSNGTLTGIGSAVAGTLPMSVAIDTSGAFLYVANSGSASVSVYSINASTGVLAAVGAAAPAGLNPSSVTVSGTLQ
jgi:YVTN family beta-propeller protein